MDLRVEVPVRGEFPARTALAPAGHADRAGALHAELRAATSAPLAMLAPSVWKPTAAGPSAVYWLSDDIGFSCSPLGDTGSLPLVDIAGLATLQ